jgi:hypothetical protein
MLSANEIEGLIAEWRSGVTEQAQRFEASRQAINEVSVTETAAGGAIMITVASSGIPIDLRLGDDVGRMKPDQIATQIMTCLRCAQARLADQVGAVVAERVGDAAGAAAITAEYQHRFPAPPDVAAQPPPPTEENAGFGLSDLDTDQHRAASAGSIPGHGRPSYPAPVPATASTAPASAARRVPASAEEDETWNRPW